MSQELLSVEESTKRLGLGRTRLYQEIGSGRLASVRVGRRRLIPEDAIEEFINLLVVERDGQSRANEA
jgi:excisionase family DNA binding protein